MDAPSALAGDDAMLDWAESDSEGGKGAAAAAPAPAAAAKPAAADADEALNWDESDSEDGKGTAGAPAPAAAPVASPKPSTAASASALAASAPRSAVRPAPPTVEGVEDLSDDDIVIVSSSAPAAKAPEAAKGKPAPAAAAAPAPGSGKKAAAAAAASKPAPKPAAASASASKKRKKPASDDDGYGGVSESKGRDRGDDSDDDDDGEEDEDDKEDEDDEDDDSDAGFGRSAGKGKGKGKAAGGRGRKPAAKPARASSRSSPARKVAAASASSSRPSRAAASKPVKYTVDGDSDDEGEDEDEDGDDDEGGDDGEGSDGASAPAPAPKKQPPQKRKPAAAAAAAAAPAPAPAPAAAAPAPATSTTDAAAADEAAPTGKGRKRGAGAGKPPAAKKPKHAATAAADVDAVMDDDAEAEAEDGGGDDEDDDSEAEESKAAAKKAAAKKPRGKKGAAAAAAAGDPGDGDAAPAAAAAPVAKRGGKKGGGVGVPGAGPGMPQRVDVLVLPAPRNPNLHTRGADGAPLYSAADPPPDNCNMPFFMTRPGCNIEPKIKYPTSEKPDITGFTETLTSWGKLLHETRRFVIDLDLPPALRAKFAFALHPKTGMLVFPYFIHAINTVRVGHVLDDVEARFGLPRLDKEYSVYATVPVMRPLINFPGAPASREALLDNVFMAKTFNTEASLPSRIIFKYRGASSAVAAAAAASDEEEAAPAEDEEEQASSSSSSSSSSAAAAPAKGASGAGAGAGSSSSSSSAPAGSGSSGFDWATPLAFMADVGSGGGSSAAASGKAASRAPLVLTGFGFTPSDATEWASNRALEAGDVDGGADVKTAWGALALVTSDDYAALAAAVKARVAAAAAAKAAVADVAAPVAAAVDATSDAEAPAAGAESSSSAAAASDEGDADMTEAAAPAAAAASSSSPTALPAAADGAPEFVIGDTLALTWEGRAVSATIEDWQPSVDAPDDAAAGTYRATLDDGDEVDLPAPAVWAAHVAREGGGGGGGDGDAAAAADAASAAADASSAAATPGAKGDKKAKTARRASAAAGGAGAAAAGAARAQAPGTVTLRFMKPNLPRPNARTAEAKLFADTLLPHYRLLQVVGGGAEASSSSSSSSSSAAAAAPALRYRVVPTAGAFRVASVPPSSGDMGQYPTTGIEVDVDFAGGGLESGAAYTVGATVECDEADCDACFATRVPSCKGISCGCAHCGLTRFAVDLGPLAPEEAVEEANAHFVCAKGYTDGYMCMRMVHLGCTAHFPWQLVLTKTAAGAEVSEEVAKYDDGKPNGHADVAAFVRDGDDELAANHDAAAAGGGGSSAAAAGGGKGKGGGLKSKKARADAAAADGGDDASAAAATAADGSPLKPRGAKAKGAKAISKAAAAAAGGGGGDDDDEDDDSEADDDTEDEEDEDGEDDAASEDGVAAAGGAKGGKKGKGGKPRGSGAGGKKKGGAATSSGGPLVGRMMTPAEWRFAKWADGEEGRPNVEFICGRCEVSRAGAESSKRTAAKKLAESKIANFGGDKGGGLSNASISEPDHVYDAYLGELPTVMVSTTFPTRLDAASGRVAPLHVSGMMSASKHIEEHGHVCACVSALKSSYGNAKDDGTDVVYAGHGGVKKTKEDGSVANVRTGAITEHQVLHEENLRMCYNRQDAVPIRFVHVSPTAREFREYYQYLGYVAAVLGARLAPLGFEPGSRKAVLCLSADGVGLEAPPAEIAPLPEGGGEGGAGAGSSSSSSVAAAAAPKAKGGAAGKRGGAPSGVWSELLHRAKGASNIRSAVLALAGEDAKAAKAAAGGAAADDEEEEDEEDAGGDDGDDEEGGKKKGAKKGSRWRKWLDPKTGKPAAKLYRVDGGDAATGAGGVVRPIFPRVLVFGNKAVSYSGLYRVTATREQVTATGQKRIWHEFSRLPERRADAPAPFRQYYAGDRQLPPRLTPEGCAIENATLAYANVCGYLELLEAGYPLYELAEHCGVALPPAGWMIAFRRFCRQRGAKASRTRGYFCDVDLDAAMAHADGACEWAFAPPGSAAVAASAAAWAKKTDGIAVVGTGGLPSPGGASSCDPAHLTNADVPEDAALLKLVAEENRRSGGVHKGAWDELREAGGFRVPRNSAGLLAPTAAQRDAATSVFYCVVSGMAFEPRAENIELPWCKRHRPADRAKAAWFLDGLAKKAKADADAAAPVSCPCHCGATVAPGEVAAWRKAVASARANAELRAALAALHLLPPLHAVTLGEGAALEAAEAAAAAAAAAKGGGKRGKGAGGGGGGGDEDDDA